MLRSMYAGISGMKNFQTKLDVIGNNIANVNTTGFKKGRVTFQDMMSQTTTGAQGPTATRGGINPAQVGLGSQLGSIDNIHTQGFRQTTNNPLDFAIEGDGMFVLASGIPQEEFIDTNGEKNPVEITFNYDQGTATYSGDELGVSFTRAGNYYLDDNGNIVNSQGYYLVGFDVDEDDGKILETDGSELTNGDLSDASFKTIMIPEDAQSFSVQTNGLVTYVDSTGATKYAGQVALANFSNSAGLTKNGSNLFLNSPNAGYNGIATPEGEGVGSIVSGSLEMSNVDLAEEFTEMITAQRGFQANTRIITTSDEILQELVNLKR